MEKNSRVKHAQAQEVKGWVTSSEVGCWAEKNFRLKGA